MAYGGRDYKLYLLRLFNDAILPANFHLLARSATGAEDFAFDCFVKLIAATIAAARRASPPSFCAAPPGLSSFEKSGDVTGIDLAARELFVVEDREKEGDRGADAADKVFAERALHSRNGLVARRAPGDELR